MSRMKVFAHAALACGLALTAVSSVTSADAANPALRSAGPLAFAPNGVLLVGDTAAGAVHAFETGDTRRTGAGAIDVPDVRGKIAAMLATTADQVNVRDIAVNPASGAVYISVMRGQGAEAAPVILKATAAGLSEVKLDGLKHTRLDLANAPSAERQRTEAITDIAYLDGKVIVAGLSNEEFASTLRTAPYPFTAGARGAGIEIWHASHGRFETASPINTFMTYTVAGKPHILAAYTCTPLVRIPVEELKDGAKVKGTTIAELGNRNRPLDMITYRKDGADYILMANSNRGVMKLKAAGLEGYGGLTERVPTTAGVPYETVASLTGVQQLDKLDDRNAVIVVADASTSALKTVGLP